MASPANLAVAEDLVGAAASDGLELEPLLTISEWADEFRVLDSKTSAAVGPWRTDRIPYAREIMDSLSPHDPVRRIVFMKGAQLGGTEIINNFLGYIIHRAPAPVLIVYPTIDAASKVSKQRIAPMIELTPVLRERVRAARSRDAGNTTFVKEFQGGLFILTGANSGAGLRSMPARFLLCDEVDDYPGDVDGQGDPVALAEKRTSNFPRRKILLVSSPTLKNLSRIEREYLASDQRRYFVPCPLCGMMDWIQWRIGGWSGEEGRHHHIHFDEHRPETARLRCASCDGLIDEHHKTQMLARGAWRPTAVGDGKTRGYHLSSLYSPIGWRSWAECVDEFLKVKSDAVMLKTWVNTVLGETWEDLGEGVGAGSVLARARRYAGEVPVGVGALVASVDVQADRLECAVKGYGAGEQSWLIALAQFHGDPGQESGPKSPWPDLDQFLKGEFLHESGQKLRIECVTIDSGHHTEVVYRFCSVRREHKVFPVKGGSERGREIVSRASTRNRYRVKLWTLCTDTAKDVIYSRLRIATPGPGYMHFPEWIDEEYVDQLTAERAVWKYVKGKGTVRQWIKIHRRNEALDLEVYCLAALHILGPPLMRVLQSRADKFAQMVLAPAPGEGGPPPAAPAPLPAKRKRRGWATNW
jgi:phage terminase large subunit GpA-like protein